MKLFGGKHNKKHPGEHAAPRKSGGEGRARAGKERKGIAGWFRHLSGTKRGLILLGGSVLVLVGVVFGIYKALVRPPDIEKPRRREETVTTVDENGQTVRVTRPRLTYTDDDGNEVEVQFDAPGAHVDGFYNILLVGTDGDGTRTDTIMIARLDAEKHTVALMSVPRDSLVYGNYSVPKINSVYGGAGKGEKGIEALEDQLSSILGFEVDGYVMVELQAFVEIVDIIGGVHFNVPQRMYYNDPTQNLHIDLYAGEQLLDGQHAMQLVRFRSYAAADIQRTQVQQDFLKALANELLSLKTITKIQPLVETCIEYVDTDLTLGNMLYFAQELLSCDLSDMYSVTLPGRNVGYNGGSYWGLNASEVLEIVNEYFNPYDADIQLSSLHIRAGSGGGGSSGGSSGGGGTRPAVTPDPVEPAPEEPGEPSGTDVLDPGGTEPEDPSDPATDPGEEDPETPETPENPGESEEPPPPETTDPPEPVDPPPETPSEPSNGAGVLDPGTAESVPPAE